MIDFNNWNRWELVAETELTQDFARRMMAFAKHDTFLNDAETIQEYAARKCYHSEGKMFHSPTFLSSLWGRRHFDIFEHAGFVLSAPDEKTAAAVEQTNKYFLRNGKKLGGSDRVWRHFLDKYGNFSIGTGAVTISELLPINSGVPVTEDRVSIAKIDNVELISFVPGFSTTWEISILSRAAANQLVRHRRGTYSQQSQRYVESTPQFIVPPSLKNSNVFMDAVHHSFAAYSKMVEDGVLLEDARFALPLCTATTLIVTFFNEDLPHFFNERRQKAAQWEIREIADLMFHQFNELQYTIHHPLMIEERGSHSFKSLSDII